MASMLNIGIYGQNINRKHEETPPYPPNDHNISRNQNPIPGMKTTQNFHFSFPVDEKVSFAKANATLYGMPANMLKQS
jgi:hypothetical protein